MSPQKPTLAALVAGGFLASLWALFQWAELLVARAGGTPFCSISETFNCAAVWDSPFAVAIHNDTMVPIAGWGLMWGIVSFALPLLALLDPSRLGKGLGAALRLNALVGVVSVLVLAAASFMAGAVCIGCMGTYALVVAWCVGAYVVSRGAAGEMQKGVLVVGGVTLASYLALLYPGMHTPHALGDVGKNAIANATVKPDGGKPNGHDHVEPGVAIAGPFDGPSTGDPSRDEALSQLMAQLPPDAKQVMANLLGDYESAPASSAVPEGRARIGEKGATVRIVDWTDPLCPHCAELHAVLDEIRKSVPPGALVVESHFFPLDGLCNPSVQRQNETGEVRCTATKALMCMENEPEKFALAQKLIFENQAAVAAGVDHMWDVLRPIADKKKLEACMNSDETTAKIAADADAANENHLEGTPLVLLNGKEVKPFGPILYALVLTGGKTKAAPLSVLPAPKAVLPPQSPSP